METSSIVRSGSFHFRRSPSLMRLPSVRFSPTRVAASDQSLVLRRARSVPDLIGSRSVSSPSSIKARSSSIQSVVTEDEQEVEIEEGKECLDGGIGKGGKLTGGGKGGRGGDDQNENNKLIRDRYKELLRSDPSNSLLLRNYGKFLHEVDNDLKGAEEMYGRALLENPVDGEVLMLYGRLLWEKYREKDRATAYMDRALEASPNDSEVLRARALFLWETDEDDDEEEEEEENNLFKSEPLVAAF